MIFADCNIIIDVINVDDAWSDWSREKLRALSEAGREVIINNVVVAEIASNFPSLDRLVAAMDQLDIEIIALDDEAAFAAGQAFRSYRRQHRERDAILADFLIGAHAEQLGAVLLTRDASLYARYFPNLPLITLDTPS
ncbi:type II toxin-antitoxin system VapC family toxin [uncultured Sphingomonas sp.]|uniref:type II toxin-antitoxin system VapC family toxin n=1 Tax=uncultured Sphingomonas sp. TaxID=158754 RepID=UPI0035CA665D